MVHDVTDEKRIFIITFISQSMSAKKDKLVSSQSATDTEDR